MNKHGWTIGATLLFILFATTILVVNWRGQRSEIRAVDTTDITIDMLKDEILQSLDGRYVRVAGIAGNAKGGACVLVNDNFPFYLKDVDAWKEDILDKAVVVEGTLHNVQPPKQVPGAPTRAMIPGGFSRLDNPVVTYPASSSPWQRF